MQIDKRPIGRYNIDITLLLRERKNEMKKRFFIPACMLAASAIGFDVLKACSQVVCPTVVSMVFDVSEMKVYWCENRQWNKIESKDFSK